MIEFIDKSSENEGTPLNRANLMAMQGFQTLTTTFSADMKTIIETDVNGYIKTTVFNDDGTVTETFRGEKTLTKTTTFNADGSITEVVS